MIAASTYLPRTSSSTMAASSIQGMGAQNFFSAIRHGCTRVSGIALGPSLASRACASSPVRPGLEAASDVLVEAAGFTADGPSHGGIGRNAPADAVSDSASFNAFPIARGAFALRQLRSQGDANARPRRDRTQEDRQGLHDPKAHRAIRSMRSLGSETTQRAIVRVRDRRRLTARPWASEKAA